MPQSSPGLIRNFTVAYVAALVLIAALVAGSATMLAFSTTEQIGDSAVLNFSGKQRMLSQRIAQFAQRRIHETSNEPATALRELANEMLAEHEALVNGNADLGIINPAPPSAREFYFDAPHNLDDRVRDYVANALALSSIEDGSSEEAARYVSLIQDEAQATLIDSLDAIATHYQQLATERINTAFRTEIFVAAVLIVMLAAVGLLLFRPLVKRSQSDLDKIIDLAADGEAKEKRLSSILETLADGVVTIDGKGVILSVNDAAAKIFGYSEEEMEGNNFRFLLPKSERRGRNSFYGSYVRDGNVGPIQSEREIIGRKKDGMEFSMELSISSLEIDGKPVFTSVVRDINDRKNAEVTLKRQAWVMENIADAVILTDPQGMVIDCNSTAEELTGYGRFELLGTPIMDLMVAGSAQKRSDVREEATSATDSGGVWRNEFEIRRKDGAIRTFENTTTGMLDERDRLIGRVSVNRDVTEQREIDRVKNEFISVVSHELRTPLTSIMGSLSLIRSGSVGELDSEAAGMIDIAHSNSERLVRLINDILDLEKIEAGRMDFDVVPLDAMTLMNQAVSDNHGFGDKNNIELKITSPVNNVSVLGDADRIAQVYANLLSNAIKFSPEGASVEIGAKRLGQKIRVWVKDNGPGISADFRSSIFGKFSQEDSSATRQQGGTGLGLSICKTIIDRLDGTIGFESVEGEGSEFFFDLPETISEKSDVTVSTVGKTALIVEDDNDAATLLRIVLEQMGLDVDVALDIERAHALVAEKSFDVVTLDLGLGGANGVDLMDSIAQSEKNNGVPVVVVSGRKREDLSSGDGGVFDLAGWIRKPVDIESLETVLRKCLSIKVSEKPRILHVEDDPDVRAVVQKILQDSVEIVRAESLAAAREILAGPDSTFDLILLDLALGDGRGEELLADLKTESGVNIPVVVFSANDLESSAAIEKIADILQKSRASNDDLSASVMAAILRHQRSQADL